MLNNDFDTVFDQMLQAQLSKGVSELDLKKVAAFMSKALNTEVSTDLIVTKSENFPVISDITGNKITIGKPNEELQDEEEVEDSTHELAVNQAAKNMFEVAYPFKSVSDALFSVKEGCLINPAAVVNLPETYDAYFYHRANKSGKKYIVEGVVPQKTSSGSVSLMESIIRCRVDGTLFHFNLPIKAIVKSGR